MARTLLSRLAWDLVDALAAVGAEYRFLLAAVTITVTGTRSRLHHGRSRVILFGHGLQ